jgi:predicted DNA-binding transcriptional regulator AlpA
MTATEPPELLTLPEVAAMTRQSQATLRWLRHDGRGPKSGKLGRRVVYRRADVEAWIAAAFEGPPAAE